MPLTQSERLTLRLAAAEVERDVLARVLNAVPPESHNTAVRESGVDLLDYTHAMEHGLHIDADMPMAAEAAAR